MRTGQFLAVMAILFLVFFMAVPVVTADGGGDHVCFSRVDSDGDGKVTPEEFEAVFGKAPKKFAAIDADGDGSLSHDEYHHSLGGGS